jgi:hypothetical protein
VSTVAERVAKGAALLDEREPGWWRDIDVDRLDLSSPCRCVLGQLTTDLTEEDDWDAVCVRFGIRPWNTHNGLPTDYELGFNAVECRYHEPPTGEEYDALTEEWLRVIAARRAVEAVPA